MKKRNMFQRVLPSFGEIPQAYMSVDEAIIVLAKAKLMVMRAIDHRNEIIQSKTCLIEELHKQLADICDECKQLEGLLSSETKGM